MRPEHHANHIILERDVLRFMNKKLMMAAGTAVVVGITGAVGAGAASAATSPSTSQTMVDKIAQRFNLNKADVQKVFDENKALHRQEREQKVSDRIDQAVKDGKLSQDQADQLKAKLEELQALHDSLEGKTKEEHRTAMRAKMDELIKWAEDNNIPRSLLGPAHAGRGMDMGSEIGRGNGVGPATLMQ